MNFIALDDEPLALVLIERLARDVPDWTLVGTFTDADTAANFLKNNAIDLLLTDINMPDVNGLDFVRSLPEEHPMVIFLTAYKEFAHEGFNLDVIDYLVKPVSRERFTKAFNKATEWLSVHQKASADLIESKDHFFVFSEYEQIKITVKDILYIEGMGDYVKIFLQGRSKPVVTLNRLKNLAQMLLESGFMRIHRSFVVNLEKINSLTKSKVRIGAGWIPVGETYASRLENRLG